MRRALGGLILPGPGTSALLPLFQEFGQPKRKKQQKRRGLEGGKNMVHPQNRKKVSVIRPEFGARREKRHIGRVGGLDSEGPCYSPKKSGLCSKFSACVCVCVLCVYIQ